MSTAAATNLCLSVLFLLLFVQFCVGGTTFLTRKVGYEIREVSEGNDQYVVVLDAGTLYTTVHIFRFDENANLLKIDGELEFTAKVVFKKSLLLLLFPVKSLSQLHSFHVVSMQFYICFWKLGIIAP